MKIGQVLRKTLDELAKQSWQSIKIWDGRIGIEITVDPAFIQPIQILLGAGLSKLLPDQLKVVLFREHDIYLRLLSYHHHYDEERPTPEFSFTALAQKINEVLQAFSSNWHSTDKSIVPLREYSGEMLTLAHPGFQDSDVILRTLAKAFGYYPDHLTIPVKPQDETTDFIFGEKEYVEKLVNAIGSELVIESDQSPRPVPSLVKLCKQYVAHQPSSFFQQALAKVPATLKSKLEQQAMEHITDAKGLEKYIDKLVIFKTKSQEVHPSPLFDCLIDEDKPNLLVGLITLKQYHDELGMIFELNTLRTIDLYNSHNLSTANLKYAKFKIKLPTPEELELINKAIVTGKGSFFHAITNDEIFKKILNQASESQTYLACAFPRPTGN